MKKLILSLLLSVPSAAQARPYFRILDLSHPQIGAGLLIDPRAPERTLAVTDLAIITHSVEDGSMIPESWRPVVPPIAWAFQIGAGGSFQGEATIAPGVSANLAPSIAAVALRGVDSSSAGWARAIKSALTGQGQGQLRIGGALAGVLVREGHFQSVAAAFPGRGFAQIIANAARVNVGYAWRF